MAGEEESIDELRSELDEQERDEYPLPEKRDKKQITYKDVDVTITFKKEQEKETKTDERRVLFADEGFGLNELIYDEDAEVLRVPIVLAKEMIYHYDDYDAFRPREELNAIASYIKGVPVTRGHPSARIVTDRSEVGGWAIEAEFEDDELRVVLEIADKGLIEDIQSGKLKGVSPGHFSRLDKTASGEYEGEHYDVTQRDIFIDHIAIVEEGRCSVADGCGIVIDENVKEKKDKEKKEEGAEERIMEPKVVVKKVEAAISVGENIEKKAEEEKTVLEEIAKVEEVPSAVLTKVKKAIGIAEKISEEAKEKLIGNLEKVKEEVAEGEEEGEKDKYPLPSEKDKKEAKGDSVTDEAMGKLEKERDELRIKLDEIVEEEKEKLVDELKSLQDIKSEDQLKEMSLDSLKSDLDLVKALRGGKFVVGDTGGSGDGAIKSAYRDVGRKGGKE